MTDAATHIRRLFLEPKESYFVRDAAEIRCGTAKSEGTNGPFWFLVSGF
ncbi:MAG TPA: hypothetical protein VNT29_02345 [Candidatus Limnocylindrales bacterium]|nr:hypothetical protein [Candidatus Limnocylindrales bacterium]